MLCYKVGKHKFWVENFLLHKFAFVIKSNKIWSDSIVFQVFEFFKKRISEQYPLHKGQLDPYMQVLEQHESFMKNRCESVLGRDEILNQVQWCDVRDDSILTVIYWENLCSNPCWSTKIFCHGIRLACNTAISQSEAMIWKSLLTLNRHGFWQGIFVARSATDSYLLNFSTHDCFRLLKFIKALYSWCMLMICDWYGDHCDLLSDPNIWGDGFVWTGTRSLTHWPLGDLNETLDKYFSSQF